MSNALRIREPYLSDRTMMEEVLETHKLMPIYPVGSRFPTSYRIMILQNYCGRQKWYRLGEYDSQTQAVAIFKRLVQKTMHNRIAALGWEDSD